MNQKDKIEKNKDTGQKNSPNTKNQSNTTNQNKFYWISQVLWRWWWGNGSKSKKTVRACSFK